MCYGLRWRLIFTSHWRERQVFRALFFGALFLVLFSVLFCALVSGVSGGRRAGNPRKMRARRKRCSFEHARRRLAGGDFRAGGGDLLPCGMLQHKNAAFCLKSDGVISSKIVLDANVRGVALPPFGQDRKSGPLVLVVHRVKVVECLRYDPHVVNAVSDGAKLGTVSIGGGVAKLLKEVGSGKGVIVSPSRNAENNGILIGQVLRSSKVAEKRERKNGGGG